METIEKVALSSAVSKQRLAAKPARRGGAADGENGDGGEETALSNLADAGMILRDPPVLHMLLHETVRRACRHTLLVIGVGRKAILMARDARQIRTLEGVVEREAVPKDDTNLGALTKARPAVVEHRCSHSRPAASQLLAYAVGVRNLLHEHLHEVTLSRDIVEKFYPLLADLILEVRFCYTYTRRSRTQTHSHFVALSGTVA